MSVVERNKLMNNDPNWDYEEVGYCAYQGSVNGTVPVYRFYNLEYGKHFFTVSLSERNKLINDESTIGHMKVLLFMLF